MIYRNKVPENKREEDMPTIIKPKKHRKLTYNKYRHNKEHTKYYNAYRDIRKEYIRKHPLDELEYIEDKYIPMEECHHVIELSTAQDDDEKMFLATCSSNLISLTKATHIKVHNTPNILTYRQREYLNNKIQYMTKILYEYRCSRQTDK